MHIVVVGLLLWACSKNETGSDNTPPPGNAEECTAAQQSGIESFLGRDTLDELSYGANFKKTYNEEGKVERLELVIHWIGKRVDSIDYHFTYEENIAHVSGLWKAYKPDSTEVLKLRTANNLNFNVTFNADGYATQSGFNTYDYSDGRLISADSDVLHFTYEYDEHGNIIKIKQFTSYGYRSLTYEYDYSKQAQHQLYLTSGHWLNHGDMNMLEVMGWLPLRPKHLRTLHWLKKFREEPNTDSTHAKYIFTDHVLTGDGKLSSFKMNDGVQLNQVVQVDWQCAD